MANYIWPLSGTTAAPDMNTSFGPRVNRQQWDFHDGIDLKAPAGTPVLAMRSGTVHRAGPAGTHGFTSRHVVLRVDDPNDGIMYLVHVHLASIDDAIVQGAEVSQGQVIGTVGEDGANYPHLHFEFRKSKPAQKYSVHPLGYLPYVNTANLTAPEVDRFNRLNARLAARLRFEAANRAEGDLQRVEVDLLNGTTLLARRIVDFNDKTTVNEGIGDDLLFVGDIGVEGYQRSNLESDGRIDLQYGILVRNLPRNCERIRGRAIDAGGNVAEGAEAIVPNQAAADWRLNFEDGVLPPAGWSVVRDPTDIATLVLDPAAAQTGSNGLRCVVSSSARGGFGQACIETNIPKHRFEWMAEGQFQVQSLQLAVAQSLRLLQFQTLDGELSVAARLRRTGSGVRMGLVARQPDGSLTSEDSDNAVSIGAWRRWRLHVRRVGTRESTAILTVGNIERARLNWDTSVAEPRAVRAGIARLSSGAAATVFVDRLRVTEATASA